MKVMRQVYLVGDPFEFRHAYNYRAREQEIEKILASYDTTGKLCILRKNLSWVMRRALIVVCGLNNEIDVGEMFRKDDKELWQCLKINGCQLKNFDSIIEVKIETLDELQKEELCKNLKNVTEAIQQFVWNRKKKDIYKRLRGYKYLQYRPKPEVVFDICNL